MVDSSSRAVFDVMRVSNPARPFFLEAENGIKEETSSPETAVGPDAQVSD
jgi:hypothetical protein